MLNLLRILAWKVLLGLSVLVPLQAQEPWQPSPQLLAEAEHIVEPEFIASWGPQGTWTQHQVDVLRAGLLSPAGPISRKAALLLDYSWLDFEEQGRVVDLLISEASRSSAEDFEDFRFCLGADDIPRLFSEMQSEPRSDQSFYLGKIHVIMRTEQALLALPLLGSDDPRLKEMTQNALGGTWGYDNSHREEIAEALIQLLGLSLEAKTVPGGLDARLVALLRHFRLEVGDFSAALELQLYQEQLINWLWRWLGDSRPLAEDLPFLRSLGQVIPSEQVSEGPGLQLSHRLPQLLVALSRCEAPEASELNKTWAYKGNNAVAGAILAAQNDDRARKIAQMMGARNKDFFSALLCVAPDLAALVIREDLRRGPKSRVRLLKYFRDDFDIEMSLLGLDWSPAVMETVRLELALLAASRPFDALALAVEIPDCLSEDLIDTILSRLQELAERMPKANCGSFQNGPYGDRSGRRMLGILETMRSRAFRRLMRTWAEKGDGDHKMFGCAALLKFGDPKAGPLLIKYLDVLGKKQNYQNGFNFIFREGENDEAQLALSPGPEVAAYLKDRSLPGQAVLAGIPIGLASWIEEYIGRTVDDVSSAAVKELIAQDDWEGAVAQYLMELSIDKDWTSSFPRSFRGLKDERLKSFLRQVQEHREKGKYVWATGQLSLMGDAPARAELWRGIKAGRYGWLDNLNEEILSNGYDPATMPYWIGELKTQCCRISTNSGTVTDLLDPDFEWYVPAERRMMTSFDFAALRYAPRPDRKLIWSSYLKQFFTVSLD